MAEATKLYKEYPRPNGTIERLPLERSEIAEIHDKGLIPHHEGIDFNPTGKTVLIPNIPKKTIERSKKIILARVQTTNKFPSVAVLSTKLGISKAKTSAVMKELVTEGFLEKKGNRYVLSQNAFNSFDPVNALDKAKAAMHLTPGMLILKTILFLIGGMATYMSIFHSSEFLSTFYTPIKGIICAITMIIFNIICAELMVFFFRKQYKSIAGLFAVLLTLGTLFSMGSTVMGLYNTRAESITIETSSENESSHKLQETQLDYQNIAARRISAQQDLDTKQARVTSLIKVVDSYTKEDKMSDSKLFDDDNYRLILANRDLIQSQKKFFLILQEEKDFLTNKDITSAVIKEIPDNSYVWLGKTLNRSPDLIQFIFSCYPAIFYDIIAPVAFSIVLFMTNTPKKKLYKRKKRRRSSKKRGK